MADAEECKGGAEGEVRKVFFRYAGYNPLVDCEINSLGNGVITRQGRLKGI